MATKKAKKASEVILELAVKVNSVVSYIQNVDNNIKIILNKLNKIDAALTLDVPPPALVQSKPSEYDEYGHPVLVESAVPADRRRVSRTDQHADVKKVSVSQQIFYPNGSPVFIGSVEILQEIFDHNKKETKTKLIKQTRTNATGRWIAALSPGKYIIHIVERGDGKSKPVEWRYEETIPTSDNPVELAPPASPINA